MSTDPFSQLFAMHKQHCANQVLLATSLLAIVSARTRRTQIDERLQKADLDREERDRLDSEWSECDTRESEAISKVKELVKILTGIEWETLEAANL